ncbi:MAG: glycosyltransferase family 4 protein [Janthinobacterium lividum]
MRVLHFYKTYKPDSQGGVEQLIWQICSGGARRGIVSEVLTVTRSEGTVDMGDHLHHRVRQDFELASSSFALAAFGEFKRRAAWADVVHYHFPWPFMDLVHFATGVKKPTVVTYHSDIVKQKHLLRLYQPVMHRFLGSVDSIVATSPNYVRTSEVLTRYQDKVSVIPIGLDRDAYPSAEPARMLAWRERIGPRFFLFVGNLRYYKGLHHLLDALAGTTFPVVIVGGGHLEAELKQQAERLSLPHVHFVGAVPDADKIALLTLCEAVLFPSHLRSEAFGISLLEGAMFGKPLLSCEIGTGTSYVNIDGETGIVVPPRDPQALREGMTWLWQHPEEAAVMGQAGHARYLQHFTADKMIDQYAALYARLADAA